MKRMNISIAVILSLCLLAGYFAATSRTIYSTKVDPTGKYIAKVSYKSYLSLIPMSPGSSSDKAGYVEIFDHNSKSMGEIPIAMLQLAHVTWHKNGASIKLKGEWDFKKGACYYWDESGNHKISCK